MSDFQDLILRAIYEIFTEKVLYRISLNEIQSVEYIKELSIQTVFNSLEILADNQYLSYRESNQERDYIIIINIKGLLKYEKDHPDLNPKFTNLTLKFLKAVKDVEDGNFEFERGEGAQIAKIPIDDFLDYADIKRNDFDKVNFIRQNGEETFHRKIGWSAKNGFVFYGTNMVFLTPEGREFLEFHPKLENLFAKVSDSFGKQILLEEYSDLHFLMNNSKWKDALIKMGSIIEYLVDDYIEYSGIGKDNDGNPIEYEIKDFNGRNRKIKPVEAKFGRKLLLIIQENVFGSNWASDWVFVNNNIREFRNYIHISKLVSNNLVVDSETVQKIYPTFERIITLF